MEVNKRQTESTFTVREGHECYFTNFLTYYGGNYSFPGWNDCYDKVVEIYGSCDEEQFNPASQSSETSRVFTLMQVAIHQMNIRVFRGFVLLLIIALPTAM